MTHPHFGKRREAKPPNKQGAKRPPTIHGVDDNFRPVYHTTGSSVFIAIQRAQKHNCSVPGTTPRETTRHRPALPFEGQLPVCNSRIEADQEAHKESRILVNTDIIMGDVKILMVSDFIACDGRVIRVLRSKKRRSLHMVVCFIFGFMGCLALFSSYENLREEDDYSREKRLGRSKMNTMVVSVSHVDYTILNTAAGSILLPDESDDSIAITLENCCGIVGHRGNLTTESETPLGKGSDKKGVSSAEDNVLQECEPTTQVRVIFSNPFWSIQALDENGRNKKFGGDEFFVVYSSAASGTRLVAKSLDQSDGTYDLDFIEPPLSTSSLHDYAQYDGSTLTVILLYTCAMGRFGPPLKADWETNGSLMKLYEFDDMNNKTVAGKKNFRLGLPPIIRRPWNDADSTDGGTRRLFPGHSLTRRRVPFQYDSGNVLKGDHLIFFGDKNALALGRAVDDFIPNEQGCPEVSVGVGSVNFSFAELPQVSLLLNDWHGETLRFPDEVTVSLILGFSSLGQIGQNFKNSATSTSMGEVNNFLPLSLDQVDHLMACEAFIRVVREQYPSVKLYWRLPVSVPFHLLPTRCHMVNETGNSACPESLQYISYYRQMQLYQAQKQLMEELGVPVLDLFDGYYVSPEEYDVDQGVFSKRLHGRLIKPLLEL